MRRLLLLPVLLLGGCAHLDLAQVSAFADRLNAGIASVDEVAHQFCPAARSVGLSAKTVACVAQANGTTQAAVNAALAWGAQFCANPASKNVGQLASHIASGVAAVANADNAGCAP